MPKNPQLILPKHYVTDATVHIKNAKHRIAIMAMVLIEDESTDELINALCDAARRGVRVEVAGDTFTYTDFQGSYFPTTYRSKRVRDAMSFQKKLRHAGAEFTWLGRLSIIPYSGRTHIKWCIVDDTVYSFGGVNLDKNHIQDFVDYMFRVDNRDLASRLVEEHRRIVTADHDGHAYRSHRFGDDDNMVLIDGGFLGDSIIYRRACYWAERAQHILYVSQYCPTGRLNRLIKKTDTDLYFNHWNSASFLNRLVIRFGMNSSQQNTKYHRRSYLHAKFIVFTMPDGSKSAITGSFNFIRGSANMGTREVALETTNKRVISQLEKFHKQHVA